MCSPFSTATPRSWTSSSIAAARNDRIERVLHFDYAACRWQRWPGTLRVVDEDLLHHSVEA
jgi:hypothetical protein